MPTTLAGSTVDAAAYAATAGPTASDPQIRAEELPAEGAADSLKKLTADWQPHPAEGARSRYAVLLYEITGWEMFADAASEAGYSALAREYGAEDQERRRIARRRSATEQA